MIFRFKFLLNKNYCFLTKRKMSSNDIAVKKLIEYLKIKTVHPEPDYGIYIVLLSLSKLNY